MKYGEDFKVSQIKMNPHKKRHRGHRATTTSRIPKGLHRAVKEFLETDQAKTIGYLHISEVITEALRQFLIKHSLTKSASQ